MLRYLCLLFPAILAVTQHYTHPGSWPHPHRQQGVLLGPVVTWMNLAWLLLPHPAVHGCSGALGARVTPGKLCHGKALLAAPACAHSCAVTAALFWAVISSFSCRLFPMEGWLSIVGTTLPIPNPSHGTAGCSGKHLVRADCVSQPELVTMSTLKR